MIKKIHNRAAMALIVIQLAVLPLPAECEVPGGENLPKLKVGAILPLSGELSFIGALMRQGIELARKDKARGLEIIYEDEGEVDRKLAVSAFQKLANTDKVHAVLGSIVATASSYGAFAERSRIPTVILWDSNDTLNNLSSYLFSVGFSTEDAGKLMADFLVRKRGLRHLGLIAAEDEWSELISRAFEERVRSLGAQIVERVQVQLQEKDLRPALLKMRQKKADAIYAPLYLGSLQSFIRQSSELQLSVPLATGDSMFQNDIDQLGAAAEGVYLTQIWIDNPAFAQLFFKEYGTMPGSVDLTYAALGYDAATMLAEVWRLVKGDPEKLREGVLNYSGSGVLGPIVFGGKRMLSRPEEVVVVKNGRVIKVD